MGTLMNSLALKVVAAAVAILLVAGGVGVVIWANTAANQSAAAYRTRHQELDASLLKARQDGYTATDLAPITSQEASLETSQKPWFVLGEEPYYNNLSTRTSQLRSQLTTLERQLLDEARTDSTKQSDAARTSITQAQQANAADLDVQGLQQRLDAVARAQGAAHTLKDYRAAAQQAQSVARDAAAVYSQVQQENQQIQQNAQQLLTQNGGNLQAIQTLGNQQVANANNDASVIAYFTKEIAFKNADGVARMMSRLGKYAAMLSSADVNQVAQGAAAAQMYAYEVHQTLQQGLPAKAVIVSFTDQHVWAFQGSQLVMDNAVTTGIRGISDFGTDFGPMKILHKDHPWKFQSPWPKGSPHWYPDTVVQWTAFFTSTGEAFHDASWQPDSTLGPGSQYTQGLQSHGCIHLPADKAQWMYTWADVGMPVIVYPGDGTSVANQLSLMTTNDQGVPISAGG
jgi:lipoprotein-anchoring transpeptidase ErfK/SrfK